uniref:Replication factor A C-terminal domain-containing protein n=1 Tax=Cannabis sativa TaxID=3483 RepID=A0A803PI58_CANSA
MSISTKNSSCFIIEPQLEVSKDLRAWITRNNCILNERITQKAYLFSATNLSPPSSDQITDISKIHDMLNMITLQCNLPFQQTSFWVKAIAKVTNYAQQFWYMACPLCNRIIGSEYGETFHCLYCKNNELKAVPRIDVQLTDSSAPLTTTVFGEIAETLFSSSDSIPNELPELHDNKQILAYIKAVKQDSTERWKYNITSFLDTIPLSNEELISNASTSHPNPTPLVTLPEKKHKVTTHDEKNKYEATNEDRNNHKASNEDQMQ